MITCPDDFAGQCVDFGNPINFITEKLDSNRMVITTGRENFNDIAANSKATTLKINVVSIKLNIYKLA